MRRGGDAEERAARGVGKVAAEVSGRAGAGAAREGEVGGVLGWRGAAAESRPKCLQCGSYWKVCVRGAQAGEREYPGVEQVDTGGGADADLTYSARGVAAVCWGKAHQRLLGWQHHPWDVRRGGGTMRRHAGGAYGLGDVAWRRAEDVW